MPRYTVWSLDVWGNEREGFNVNDRCKVGSIDLTESDAHDDKRIVRTLVSHGYLKSVRFHFDTDGEADYSLYVNHEPTGRPLLELQREDTSA